MKILYVKNNSERAREFQLRTIIYEENGQKYVVKQALVDEAIPHLKKMKKSFQKLSDAIINPRIKLAKIIDESDNSLTFEFIEGISLEKKYKDAQKISTKKANAIQDEYFSLLNNGFRTLPFDSTTMVTPELKSLFGDINYKPLDGQPCFDGISNIDLIFSNIIYKNNDIYLIDYEWVFDINIFVDYAAYRAIHHDANKWEAFEKYFLDDYVIGKKGFHHIQNNYLQARPDIVHQLQSSKKDNQGKEEHIQELIKDNQGKEEHIQELSKKLHQIGEDLGYARSIVDLRDEQINFLYTFIESLHLKNRFKHTIKKFIPKSILKIFGFTKNHPLHIDEYPHSLDNKKSLLYKYKTPKLTLDIMTELNEFIHKPRISIVMPVYNVDPKWLDLAIKSIESQWYQNWELCIADDKSTHQETLNYLKQINNPKIKITYLKENLNISGASNAALSLSTGEYIALLDNDDELTPDALYEMVKVINLKDADFIYSDEDFIDIHGECSNPHYKPDFSPDLLLSHNYITHFSCFKKSLLDKAGYFNSDFDGSQDYDLFLRMTEQTDNIQHIQKVLYHWRTIEGSTSADSEAKPEAIARSKRVLEEVMKRRGIDATVENGNLNHFFHVKYAIKNNPLISIIIPFKDKPELLDMSINSILEKSTYQNFEIIGISNNSEEQTTFDMMKTLQNKDNRVSFYEYNTEFNYADINNHAVNNYAKGEHVLLLNNDIEVIEPAWLEAMLEHSQRDEIGCVGAKLYYPNDTIQHAGIIIGLGGYAGHSHKMYPRDNPGYFNRLNAIQNLSAVTAACLMIKKSIYQEINGMDDVKFKVAYNDVDFCLRVREKGYLNIFTPYAEAYHHESISRGYETTPEKIARFQTEKDALGERHKAILIHGDPYYNPNLSQDKEDFSLCLK